MTRSFIFLWVTVIVLILFFWIYFPVLSRYRELKIEEEKITQELEDLDRKIRALTEERNLLRNDVTYLEKVVREELGLVKPGEIVYKLVPDETPAPSQAGMDTNLNASSAILSEEKSNPDSQAPSASSQP
ncbi:MAG: septum formation initiator family protein [Candidatus Omnitrophica bacterium]|nr:septum formation initiator family protein [Candidatus Omnitrophota bacterium]